MKFGNKLNFSHLLLPLLLVGYPAVSSFSIILFIESNILSILFRVIVLIISINLFIKINKCEINISKNSFFSFSWYLFWLLYIARLFIDTIYFPENLRFSIYEYFCYIVLTCFIPATACKYISYKHTVCKAKQYIYFLIFLTCLGIIISKYIENLTSFNIVEIFNLRLETTKLNSISISHTGYILSTLVFCDYFEKKIKLLKFFILFFCGIILGILGGSRGPFIAFIISLFLYITFNNRKNKNMFISLLLLTLLFLWIVDFLFDITLFRRLINHDPSDSIRYMLFQSGIEVIKNNLLFGAGIEPLGFWPHNTILEAFILNGIIGGGLYLIILYNAFKKSYNLLIIQHYSRWIVLLYIQFFIIAMVNSSLYLSIQLWALIIVINYLQYKDID